MFVLYGPNFSTDYRENYKINDYMTYKSLVDLEFANYLKWRRYAVWKCQNEDTPAISKICKNVIKL